jgi:hypothetical protein
LSDLKADSARWAAERQRSSSNRGLPSGGISPRASDTVVRRSNVQSDGYARSSTRRNQQWNASEAGPPRDQREYAQPIQSSLQQQQLRGPQSMYSGPNPQWPTSYDQSRPSYNESSNYEIAGAYAPASAPRAGYPTDQTYPSEQGRGVGMQGYQSGGQPAMYYPQGGQRSAVQQSINPGYGPAQVQTTDFPSTRGAYIHRSTHHSPHR